MTDEVHTPQTDAAGSKRGGRKGGPSAPGGHVGAGVSQRDQPFNEESTFQESAQAAALVPFDFQGKDIRTITKNGEFWFVAADACAALEIGNTTDAMNRLDDDEKGIDKIETRGGQQRLNVITESGLYDLVSTSQKPEAIAFRRWVRKVVLPTLRRTGKFDMRSEHGPGPVRDEIDGASRNRVTVALPGPGRYLVVLFHDGERRIQPLSFSDAVSVLAALDCRSIAYTHLTAASLWEKLQHLGSVKGVRHRTGRIARFAARARNGSCPIACPN